MEKTGAGRELGGRQGDDVQQESSIKGRNERHLLAAGVRKD
jgi:hypothetical protein